MAQWKNMFSPNISQAQRKQNFNQFIDDRIGEEREYNRLRPMQGGERVMSSSALGGAYASGMQDLSNMGLPQFGMAPQGLPTVSESGQRPMMPQELQDFTVEKEMMGTGDFGLPMLQQAQSPYEATMQEIQKYDEYGLPMQSDEVSTSQSGTINSLEGKPDGIVTAEKNRTVVNNQNQAQSEAPRKGPSKQEMQDQEKRNMQILGAGLKDLGSIFTGKDSNELNRVADRMQKDEQFQMQMQMQQEAQQNKLREARLGLMASKANGRAKQQLEIEKANLGQANQMRGELRKTKGYTDHRLIKTLGNKAIGALTNDALEPGQKDLQLLFYDWKMRDPDSAILLSELEASEDKLGYLRKVSEDSDKKVPAWVMKAFQQVTEGGSLGDFYREKLGQSIIGTMRSSQDIYNQAVDDAYAQADAINKQGTFFVDKDQIEIRDSNKEIYKVFNNYIGGGARENPYLTQVRSK